MRDSERLYDELAEKHVPADLYILKGAEYLNTKFLQLHVFKIIEKFLAENEHSYVALGVSAQTITGIIKPVTSIGLNFDEIYNERYCAGRGCVIEHGFFSAQ